MTIPKLATIERLITLAKARHKGPPLYLLNTHQREIWDAYQRKQSAQTDRYERYLEGNTLFAIDEELPRSIRHLLGMDREPITIPIDTTSDQVREIYERYLDGY